MSSFFTIPSAQKKRKRNETGNSSTTRRTRNPDSTSKTPVKRSRREESISGSDSELSEKGGEFADDTYTSDSSGDGDEDETGAERRLKLAERYLENVKSQVADQQAVGFDAEDVDRDLIAERLKEDVAETKGRLYRYIASSFDYSLASSASFRNETHCMTSIALCLPYAYTVSHDLSLTKWSLPTPSIFAPRNTSHNPKPFRRRPTKLVSTKGNRKKASDNAYQHHTAPILCVAASADGKFVATGGADRKLIVWDAADLKPLRVFTQHRDAVTSLAFRRGTNQLYTASSDRTLKTWSLDELAYIETLFGHQDAIVDVAALAQERCLSAGARDRTVRLWKVVDETQLVFRGGGEAKKQRKDKRTEAEGSIDRVAFIDDDTFVTGSDNGALCLWSVHKKKPIYTIHVAHDRDPALRPEDVFAETDMHGREVPVGPEARWITALRAIPYSDLVISGSWDGEVRVWRITPDRKKIERIGCIGKVEPPLNIDEVISNQDVDDTRDLDVKQHQASTNKVARGVINDLQIFERDDGEGEDGKGRAGLCVVVALGTHHRLGKWKKVTDGRNGAVVFEIPRKLSTKSHEDESQPDVGMDG